MLTAEEPKEESAADDEDAENAVVSENIDVTA